jgi:hypothetical protein
LPSFCAGAYDGRQQEPGQHANDHDHHQQLHQRESGTISIGHSPDPFYWAAKFEMVASGWLRADGTSVHTGAGLRRRTVGGQALLLEWHKRNSPSGPCALIFLFSQKDSKNASHIGQKRPTRFITARIVIREVKWSRNRLIRPFATLKGGVNLAMMPSCAAEIGDLLGYRWHFWEAFARIDQG